MNNKEEKKLAEMSANIGSGQVPLGGYADQGVTRATLAAEACGYGGVAIGNGPGPGGYAIKPEGRETLVQRIRNRASHAEMQANKTAALQELLFLLNENPTIARILDLLDTVG